MNDKSFFDEETVEKVREYEKSDRVKNEEKKRFEEIKKTEIMGNAAKSKYKNKDLLEVYIGKNYEKIAGKSFNGAAFLLGSFYLLYRKMYLYGFLLMLFNSVVSVYLSAVITESTNTLLIILGFLLVIDLVIGATFNGFYLNKCVSNIEIIQKSYSGDDAASVCKKKGGTNILVAIILLVIMSGLSVFIANNLNVIFK